MSNTVEIKKKKEKKRKKRKKDEEEDIYKRFRDIRFVGFRDLGFVKFQFPIISLVDFCNYSLFFLNLKYMLDIKGI